MSRQQAELHLRERWDLTQWLERKINKLERAAEPSSALRKVLNAERLAANRDTELERSHGNHCKR